MLEAIIATGIIVTAISSALTLVSSSINAEKNSQALLGAGNLAREGIEAVRAIRDSNWLAGAQWDLGIAGGAGFDYTGIPVFAPASNSWSISWTPNAVSTTAPRVCRHTTGAHIGLQVNTTAAGCAAGTVDTGYRRLVIVDAICDNGPGNYTVVTSGTGCGSAEKVGIRVTSRVLWAVGTNVRTLNMEERLYNWR